MRLKSILSRFLMILGFVFSISRLSAQNTVEILNYRIDSLMRLNLPKSALLETDKLEAWAKTHKDIGQQIRACIYRMNLTSYLGNDSFDLVINKMKEDIGKAVFPVKPVIQSLLAEVYFKYYQQNRYQFLNRTPLLKPDPDYRNWDLKTLIQETSHLYQLSLLDEIREQNTSLEILDLNLEGDKSTRYLRPSLYDILVHRALDFYLSKEPEITRPTQPFDLNNSVYFREAEAFSRQNIQTTDSLSPNYWGLIYLQKVTRFHLKDSKKDPLMDLDLKRIEFVYTHSSFEDRDSLYLGFLKDLYGSGKKSPVSAEVQWTIGNYFRDKDSLIIARRYYEKALADYPQSLGGQNSAGEIGRLGQKFIQLSVEDIQSPGKPILANLEYKNLDKAGITIYKLSKFQSTEFQKLSNDYTNKNRKELEFLKKMKAYRQKNLNWHLIRDYKQHRFEFSLDSFQSGHYVYLLDGGEEKDTSLISLGSFDITRISQSIRVNPDGKTEIRVMDRENGNPLVGVKLHLEGSKNEFSQSFNIKEDGKTNEQGQFITYKFMSGNRSYPTLLEFNYMGNEYFKYSPSVSGEVFDSDTSFEKKDLIFTDRQIYRPGQALYFKVLKTSFFKELSRLLTKDSVTIRLKDANSKEIGKYSAITNEFGSVAGKFIIPKDVLPGNFSLETDDGDMNIRVEEYKRPSFRLEFLPIKNSYTIGDSVQVKGLVKAYSGYGLSQTKIHYHITRTRNPYFNTAIYGSNAYIMNESNNPDEIQSGNIESNNQGEFTLSFKASPNSKDKKPYPIYNYFINVACTDGAGETQTLDNDIKIGPIDIALNFYLPEILFTKDTFNTFIRVKNLNGQFISGKVQTHFWKVQNPEKIFTNRLWNKPDQLFLNKEEFHRDFPEFSYSDEENRDTWEKTKLSLGQALTLNSEQNGVLDLNSLRKEKPGLYKIQIIGKNQHGDSTSDFRYVKLVQDLISPTEHNDWEIPIINLVKPGEDAKFQVGINEPLHVLVEEMDGQKMILSKWVHLEGGSEIIKFPISAQNKRPSIQFMMVYKNRYYFKRENIIVIYPDTSLNIRLTSFRDKLEPGSKEAWKILVSNPKANRLPDEVLAGLYDASLDFISGSIDWNNDIRWGIRENENFFSWGQYYLSQMDRSASLKYSYFIFNPVVRDYEKIDLMGYNYFGGYNPGYNYFNEKESQKKFRLAFNRKKVKQYENLFKLQLKKPHSGIWVYGCVLDKFDGSPILGAILKANKISSTVTTDFNGFFKLYLQRSDTISFSSIGYLKQTRIIHNDQFLRISLISNTNKIKDIVVMGYSTTKKADLTGAVSRISIRGYNTVSTALSGKVLGLSLTGAPGGSPSIMLRGNSNVNAIYGSEAPKAEDLLGSVRDKVAEGSDLESTNPKPIVFRKNFNETAFFYPQLRTNEKGELKLEFTMPDALTEWKFRVLTHNQNRQWGYFETKVVTQKSFSIEANMPRFLREGDTLRVSARLSNLSDKKLLGKVHLILFNSVNMNPVNLFLNPFDSLQSFELMPQSNKPVSFTWVIPKGLEGLTYRLSAESGNYSDGEENTLPVLSNRILVTETMPMMIRSGQTTNFSLDKLLHNTSTTLENKTLTLEYTQNPAWYALLSMPYLMEFPHECSEQLFSRYFANSLATQLMNHNPLIKKVFDSWKEAGSSALLSNLERNPELKSTLLEETPWLREANGEAEQKKRLFLLFDLNKMSSELKANLDKLKERQLSSGGFTWFGGEYADRYITEHILSGIGQLERLGIDLHSNSVLLNIRDKAIAYLDSEMERDYRQYHSRKAIDSYSYMDHYSWYVRSFFTSKPLSPTLKLYFAEYLKEVEKDGLTNSLYNQGLMAFTLLRSGKTEMAEKIIHSLIERSQDSPEMGMYWAENRSGYYWYESPVETQALMIELFTEEGHNSRLVEEMKIWLLRNKQTNNWSNTKATSEAIYALLLKQDHWLSDTSGSMIHLGSKSLTELKPELKKEMGTGYFKTSWTGSSILPEMAQVKVENKGNSIAWGGLYWQYLENLDKITPANTDIVLSRKYFIQKNSDRGLVLQEIDAQHQPKVGDLVKVVVYLKSGRDYEYVQLKDMRPAGTEPVTALSEYKYQDGLYYYQVTKDVATNFFLSYLPKGNYVFEYGLRVAQPGNFSTGISSIQCMYAPEFTAHSEGKRIVFQP